MTRSVRIAVRALILHENRLLMVNAWPEHVSDLWCAPGGGVKPNSSLPDNLIREVFEETGLTIAVGAPVLVNEFHDPDRPFHQVDVYFRCTIANGQLAATWTDPEAVVTQRRFFSREDLAAIRYKPDSLPAVAWGDPQTVTYDPLELLVR